MRRVHVLVALLTAACAACVANDVGRDADVLDAGGAAPDAGLPCLELSDEWAALDDSCAVAGDCALVGQVAFACSGGPGFYGRAVNLGAVDDADAILAELASDRCAPLRADERFAPQAPQDWTGLKDPLCVDGGCRADFACGVCNCQERRRSDAEADAPRDLSRTRGNGRRQATLAEQRDAGVPHAAIDLVGTASSSRPDAELIATTRSVSIMSPRPRR